MQIDRLLEGMDLTIAHMVLALTGFFLSIYVMQLIRWEAEDDQDPPVLQSARRIAYAILAWGYLWSLSYGWTKAWQPWPAELLMMAAMNAVMTIRVFGIKARIRRSGIKPEAPRAAKLGSGSV